MVKTFKPNNQQPKKKPNVASKVTVLSEEELMGISGGPVVSPNDPKDTPNPM
ncbi:MAG: hypothetical protein F6K42_08295 [Leptolyngbya sp. SIO1D8]|nr:hypothetical protein [Leptolyngbya sp. SIO1D8]